MTKKSNTHEKMTEKGGVLTDLNIRSVVWLGLLASLVFYGFAMALLHFTPDVDLALMGSAGDFVGGMLNPIVALLGIMLLAMTLKQNSVALELTRIELEKSAEQMQVSAEALNKQEQHMRHESIERTILFICGEIEKEYERKYQQETVPDETTIEAITCIKTISERACDFAFRDTKKADFILDHLYEGVERVVSLFFILGDTLNGLEKNIKDSMLTVIACKLNNSVVVAMYVEVLFSHDNYNFGRDKQLNDVLDLLDNISIKNRNPIHDHPLHLMYL